MQEDPSTAVPNTATLPTLPQLPLLLRVLVQQSPLLVHQLRLTPDRIPTSPPGMECQAEGRA